MKREEFAAGPARAPAAREDAAHHRRITSFEKDHTRQRRYREPPFGMRPDVAVLGARRARDLDGWLVRQIARVR
jgi:hypothetical protein